MGAPTKKSVWGIYGDKRKRTIKKWYQRYGSGPHKCWLCGKPIETDFTFDHVKGVREWPEYAFEISNLRPAHQYCNAYRSFWNSVPGRTLHFKPLQNKTNDGGRNE